MSIRIEQYRSLLMTREFLYDLLYPAKTPRVPSAVRKRAHDCLRHFPFLDGNGAPIFSQDSIGLDDMASPAGNPVGVTFDAQNVSEPVSAADELADHIGDVTELINHDNNRDNVSGFSESRILTHPANVARSGSDPATESGNDSSADCRIDHIGDVTELVPYVGPDVCPVCRGRKLTEPMADFIGDDPRTMKVCTMNFCLLCGGTGRDPNWRRIDTSQKPVDCADTIEPFGDSEESIDDGCGNSWSIVCPTCGRRSMQVVRPGKAQCSLCG